MGPSILIGEKSSTSWRRFTPRMLARSTMTSSLSWLKNVDTGIGSNRLAVMWITVIWQKYPHAGLTTSLSLMTSPDFFKVISIIHIWKHTVTYYCSVHSTSTHGLPATSSCRIAVTSRFPGWACISSFSFHPVHSTWIPTLVHPWAVRFKV